jgi:hypothetical protein
MNPFPRRHRLQLLFHLDSLEPAMLQRADMTGVVASTYIYIIGYLKNPMGLLLNGI